MSELSIYDDGHKCPHCSSSNTINTNYYIATNPAWIVHFCNDCNKEFEFREPEGCWGVVCNVPIILKPHENKEVHLYIGCLNTDEPTESWTKQTPEPIRFTLNTTEEDKLIG